MQKTMAIVTATELRAEFRISKSTLDRLIREGMPVMKMGERVRRFDRPAVMKWLEERQQEKAAPTSGDA